LNVIFLNMLDNSGILLKPVYVNLQFGFGSIPPKGFELIVCEAFLIKATLFASLPVYAAIKEDINTSCEYLP
ncbi:hypothetical protein ABTC78_19155, partial [Acinetobacter baumannii]